MNRIMRRELPIYVNNFKIFDFDTSSIEKRYRVVSETCDIEISKSVKELLDFIKLNEGKTSSIIIDKFCSEKNSNIESVNRALSLLFKKGILSNEKKEYKEIKEENYYRNKMEHLWFRACLIDTEKHKKFFASFSFVFSKSFVASILSLFFLFDIVFITSYFFTNWSEQLIYYSALDYFWLVFVYGYIMIFLHETGHIAAAKRYNSKTGGIGFGIYYYFLVFYADVHETWNLPRKQRRVVSIAGFYWDIIAILPIFILCFYLKSKAIADFILLFHLSFIGVFNPFLKMDGYWFLCDVLGVPNLRNRINTYLFQYLPSKLFKKNKVNNPFRSYPGNVRKGVRIYLVMFIVFMCFFLSLFLFRAVNIALNIETEIISSAKLVIENWQSGLFNKLIRNCFILFGGTMFLIRYIKKLIRFLFRKVHSVSTGETYASQKEINT